jgi:CRISPR-associated protein Cas2
MRYVVAYDVSDDARRTRLANLLETYGERVQFSVFECDLDRRELAQVIAAVEHLAWPGTDRVRFYRLCGACAREVESIGACRDGLSEDVLIV